MTEYSKDQAAKLAAFYAGGPDPEGTPAPAPIVKGGLPDPKPSAALAPAPVQPGSWQDLESRGIPFTSWPPQVLQQFMTDQENGVFVPPVLPHTEALAPVPGQPSVQPGTWQDFEARNIPYESWPEHIKERFLYEQDNPQEAVQTAPVIASIAPAPISAPQSLDEYAVVINHLSEAIHRANIAAGWWTDLATGQTLLGKDDHGRDRRNVGELLCLVHSEVSEAMEGYRKNLMDDKLPHRSMLEVELADVFIRIFDIAGAHNLDLGGAIAEKRSFNANRADHKVENRLAENGKKF